MNEENIKEIASIAWRAAANAHRLYPEGKHTFANFWDSSKFMFNDHIKTMSFTTTEVIGIIEWINKLEPYNRVSVHPSVRNLTPMELINSYLNK